MMKWPLCVISVVCGPSNNFIIKATLKILMMMMMMMMISPNSVAFAVNYFTVVSQWLSWTHAV